ncbi:MAG: nucleotide exchange factor GrpE, partial [Candidatus Marinimicrobia bacterium]|nr:nucleotide exchange factor GrpE [Candidatus Neomarinimicrobiota bacterium]
KGKKDNEILEVFEKGYKYKDHVLRHAKVIVNKK